MKKMLVPFLCLLLVLVLSGAVKDGGAFRLKCAALETENEELKSLLSEVQQQNAELLLLVNQITGQLEQIQQTQESTEKTLEELKAQTFSRIPGGNAEFSDSALTVSPESAEGGENTETMVWVSKTGSKYHSSPTCSNMKNPTQIPLSTALARGLTPCSRCF